MQYWHTNGNSHVLALRYAALRRHCDNRVMRCYCINSEQNEDRHVLHEITKNKNYSEILIENDTKMWNCESKAFF